MRHSEQTKEVFEALAKAQGAFDGAKKDSTNPHFKSKYADLASVIEAIRPAMAANGLSALQEVALGEKGVAVTTLVTHASGQWVEFGPIVVPLQKQDAHGVGSAATYARRYALSAALGVAAEDDDGNASTQPQAKQQWQKPTVIVATAATVAESKPKASKAETKQAEVPQTASEALKAVGFEPEAPFVVPSGSQKGKQLHQVDSESLKLLSEHYESKYNIAKKKYDIAKNEDEAAAMKTFGSIVAQIEAEMAKRENGDSK